MKPNWKDAPEWANYWAVDEDGACWWYGLKPYIEDGQSRWEPDCKGEWKHEPQLVFPNWKESLQKRPKDKS